MTINQQFGKYRIQSASSDGEKLEIEHIPTGKTITLDRDTILVNGQRVVSARKAAIGVIDNQQTATTSDGILESIGDTTVSDSSPEIERNISELNSKINQIINILGSTSGHGLTED